MAWWEALKDPSFQHGLLQFGGALSPEGTFGRQAAETYGPVIQGQIYNKAVEDQIKRQQLGTSAVAMLGDSRNSLVGYNETIKPDGSKNITWKAASPEQNRKAEVLEAQRAAGQAPQQPMGQPGQVPAPVNPTPLFPPQTTPQWQQGTPTAEDFKKYGITPPQGVPANQEELNRYLQSPSSALGTVPFEGSPSSPASGMIPTMPVPQQTPGASNLGLTPEQIAAASQQAIIEENAPYERAHKAAVIRGLGMQAAVTERELETTKPVTINAFGVPVTVTGKDALKFITDMEELQAKEKYYASQARIAESLEGSRRAQEEHTRIQSELARKKQQREELALKAFGNKLFEGTDISVEDFIALPDYAKAAVAQATHRKKAIEDMYQTLLKSSSPGSPNHIEALKRKVPLDTVLDEKMSSIFGSNWKSELGNKQEETPQVTEDNDPLGIRHLIK